MATTPSKLSKSEGARLGLPEGIGFYSSAPFGSLNLTDDRIAIEDNEFFYLENFIRIGKCSLRTLWDRGTALYTAPSGKTIIYFFWFSIGLTEYCAVFLSDGTAIQVDTLGNPTVITSVPNTFYNPAAGSPQVAKHLPSCAQWGEQFLLISNDFAQNNYWAWDGTVLYQAGSISPVIDFFSGGSGYSGVPAIETVGGHGSGIVVVPQIVNGSVVALTITNPGTGYLPGDVVQFIFFGGGTDSGAVLQASISGAAVQFIEVVNGGTGYAAAPAVTISGGGGSGATATATVSGGAVTGVAVISGGANYTGSPTIGFTVSGSGATATATISGGAVTSVIMTSGGSGYLTAPTVVFSGAGTGAVATATINTGQVTSVTVVTGGSGYVSGSTSVIFETGGSGAVAVASLTPGTVTSVNVVYGGTGYIGTPTLTFQGGGGAGATGTAVLTGQSISSVTITSGGSGYTDAPSVIVSAGVNNAASAQAELMPFIVSGSAIETFLSRVWLVNPYATTSQATGGVINTSAPGSMSDFASSDGGSQFTANEPFLRQQFFNLKQAQGYLYTFSDCASDVISNVQTSGSPITTTFNYQNVDPQEGTTWRDTVQYYGLSILYGNATGEYGLYGGAVKNLSRSKLNSLFDSAIFPPTAGAVFPSSAVANIHTIKTYLMLMTITDPVTGLPREVMVGWDETDWFLASQSANLTFIGTQASNSLYTAWGTDGNSLFPLFNVASQSLEKRFSTKLFGAQTFPTIKISDGVWFLATDVSADQSGITFNVNIDSEFGSFTSPISPLEFPGPQAAGETGDIYGSFLGLSVTSTSADFVLKHMVLGYETAWGGYGGPPTTTDQ